MNEKDKEKRRSSCQKHLRKLKRKLKMSLLLWRLIRNKKKTKMRKPKATKAMKNARSVVRVLPKIRECQTCLWINKSYQT